MKPLMLATAISLTAGAAFAQDCTPEMVSEKTATINDMLPSLSETNPDLFAELAVAFEQALAQYPEGSDMTGACETYDGIIARMEG
ncbi:MAG: hypothetical protein ACPGID_04005 [Rubricella sp.]